jgi:hypothetical protein
MYVQRPSAAASSLRIRKCSPRGIQTNGKTPPINPENWHHLVNIVMRLVHDKQVKDSMIEDLKTRVQHVETTIDTGTPPILSRTKVDVSVPMMDTFTSKSIPSFLRGRLRRSYVLISKPLSTRHMRRLSYRLTFHQYLGVPGLGIGVSPSTANQNAFHTEEILFLTPEALDRLAKSLAGEKERKLPDSMLRYMRGEKREFVRDWMKGYINLDRDDEEFAFSVEATRGEKDIWIEYIGMFDGSGGIIGENKLGYPVASQNCRRQAGAGCGTDRRARSGEDVVEVSVSRMDIVM